MCAVHAYYHYVACSTDNADNISPAVSQFSSPTEVSVTASEKTSTSLHYTATMHDHYTVQTSSIVISIILKHCSVAGTPTTIFLHRC